MPSQPCLQPSAFLTCPSLTHHLRHAAERVLGHRRGQSGQRTGADQGKHCPLGSDSSLAPLGAPRPLRLSPKVCSVWLGPAPSGRPRQGGPVRENSWRATHPRRKPGSLSLSLVSLRTAASLVGHRKEQLNHCDPSEGPFTGL